MEQFKCAFNATLIGDQFGCRHSAHVTRRAGPDVACQSPTANVRCAALFERLKQAALPAFGVEDDLLSMPHSVLVKIQHGGLLGLQRLVGGTPADPSAVTNIDELVEQALAHFQTLETLPCADLVRDMTSFKLRRRS